LLQAKAALKEAKAEFKELLRSEREVAKAAQAELKQALKREQALIKLVEEKGRVMQAYGDRWAKKQISHSGPGEETANGEAELILTYVPMDTDKRPLSGASLAMVVQRDCAAQSWGTHRRVAWWVVLLVVPMLVCRAGAAGEAPVAGAYLLDIKGAIGPATAHYMVRGLVRAQEEGARLVILRMDTPGGLDSAMRKIVKAILASTVPVVGYVAPPGARAASAGTYILYATQVAAMAPATTLGAATPVRIGGIPDWPGEADRRKPTGATDGGDEGPGGGSENGSSDAMERKLVNDAVAYIRALANRYGRNADWAESAVREAVTLTAAEALEQHVIDVMAANVPELLLKIDGRQVVLVTGERVVHTLGLVVQRLEPGWRDRLLGVIGDPNIAYILMLVGIYGLIFEMAHPGALFPGVIGAICLVLALYAFQVLPVNYTGMALMLLGVAFMLAEAFVPSFGVLGLGGVLAFVAGSVMLMEETESGVSLPLIGGTALVSAGFFLWVISRLVRMRRRRALTGRDEMIGLTGRALEDIEHTGRVWVHSESWTARTAVPINKGQSVRVTGINGLELEVEPIDSDTPLRDAKEDRL